MSVTDLLLLPIADPIGPPLLHDDLAHVLLPADDLPRDPGAVLDVVDLGEEGAEAARLRLDAKDLQRWEGWGL